MPSKKNKAKICEFRLSRHRSCIVTIYPSSTVTIVIRCSKDPFDLFSKDGIFKLTAICGQILEKIIEQTRNFKPLKTEILNWRIIQIDAAYDIPLKQDAMSLNWLGCLRIKHLLQIYQIYVKMLPNKGRCLRLERRFSFKTLQPDIETFENSCS